MRSQHPVRIGCQIGIGPLPPAPDPAAKLVKLRKAEHIGTVDDHRVRGWNVDS